MPFFVGDFLASTAGWPSEARGTYALLLMYQWTLKSLPADPKELRRLLGIHGHNAARDFEKIWGWMGPKFGPSEEVLRKIGGISEEVLRNLPPGRILNARLEQHRQATEELRKKRSEMGKNAAVSRWKSDAHGNTPDQTIQEKRRIPPIPPLPESPPIPPISETNTSHQPELYPSPAPKKGRKAPELPDYPPELNREAWAKWTHYRSQIRKPYKVVSLAAAMKRLTTCGDHAAQMLAVDQSIANGWTGVFPSRGHDSVNSARRLTFDEQMQKLQSWKPDE